MIFLLISNLYFVSDPWFFCFFPNNLFFIKSVLRAQPMIFLLISNMYFISDLWFFCFFPNKSIQIQMCTLHKTHDFFAYFLYRIIGNQMSTSSKTHNFSAFSFTNIKIQISTSCQTHDFSSSFYTTQYEFKSVPRTKPMIFLLISFIELLEIKYILYHRPILFLLSPLQV